MPSFGDRSKRNLETCDRRLQQVAFEAIKHTDFAVTEGFRGEEEQNAAFHAGLSKLKWDLSKHNQMPSKAVHFIPYPINWNDTERFYFLGGFIVAIGLSLDVVIRYGGDWDMDGEIRDQTFNDLGHYELID